MRLGIDFRGAQTNGSGTRGIGRYTTELVKGLLAYAPECDVVLFVKNGEVPDELRACSIVPVSALSWTDPSTEIWTKIPKVRSLNFLHARRFRQSLTEQKLAMEQALRENPVDLLHIPSALDIGSYPIYNYPCPVVMTFLDAIVHHQRDSTYDRFRPFMQDYYQLQVLNLKKADRLVAISHASAKDACEIFHVEHHKIDVVYPAVSPEYGVPRPRPPWLGDEPYFLFCSVPDPHKNPNIVIEAFSHMPKNYRLIFVTPKDHESNYQLIKQVATLGFEDRFTCTGYVQENDLYALFQHATALVSPSQMEGFGLPVAQAMRAGTPVVTSKRSAQGEIANGVGYLVDPNSIEEVARAMQQVIADRGSLDRIARGIERAKQFDSELVTHQLLECYKKCLGLKS